MSQQETSTQPNEWPILAGLRFFLASLVLAGHVIGLSPGSAVAARALAQGGPHPAVLAFFLVSGYSIAASVERHADYYKRRALRILPVYYMCLAVAVAAMFTWPQHGGLSKRMLLVNIVLLQGVFRIPAYYGFGQSWTLVCEAAYYVVAPMLKRFKTGLILALAGLSVFGYARVLSHPGFIPDLPAAKAAACLAWAWLLGFVYYRNLAHSWARWLFVAGFTVIGSGAMVASIRLIGSGSMSVGCRLVGIGNLVWCFVLILAAPVIIVLARRIQTKRTTSTILNYLGDLSYPLYLVHMPIIVALVMNRAAGNSWMVAAISLFAAVIVNAIDRPIQRSRKRFYAKATAPQLPPAELTLSQR